MFCTQILFKINSERELTHKLKLRNFINKIFSIKYGAKYALEKIKNRRDKETFVEFNKVFKEKRLKTLKDIFFKIKKRAFNNKLKKTLKIPRKFRNRVLKRVLLKWKENANKIASKHSAEMLQKNMRLHLYKKKQENKKNILKHLLLKLIEKNQILSINISKDLELKLKKLQNMSKKRNWLNL